MTMAEDWAASIEDADHPMTNAWEILDDEPESEGVEYCMRYSNPRPIYRVDENYKFKNVAVFKDGSVLTEQWWWNGFHLVQAC